jgi:integrase
MDARSSLDVAEPTFCTLVAVCAFAGLRLGEAAALRLDDVDFLRRELLVRRQVQRIDQGAIELRVRAAGRSGIRLHDLMHFSASGLISAGCDVVMVQRALGHAKPTTTLETYSHLWPSAEDRTRKAAALLAGEVLDARVGRMWAESGN